MDKYNDVDVTVYEAGDFISFMSCGMQLYLENKVTAEDDVRNFAPEDVEKKGGHVYANHEVTAIHPEHKTVTVKDLTNNSEEKVQYDKLILSSGVTPKVLPVPGNDLKNIYLMRGRDWASKLIVLLTIQQLRMLLLLVLVILVLKLVKYLLKLASM